MTTPYLALKPRLLMRHPKSALFTLLLLLTVSTLGCSPDQPTSKDAATPTSIDQKKDVKKKDVKKTDDKKKSDKKKSINKKGAKKDDNKKQAKVEDNKKKSKETLAGTGINTYKDTILVWKYEGKIDGNNITIYDTNSTYGDLTKKELNALYTTATYTRSEKGGLWEKKSEEPGVILLTSEGRWTLDLFTQRVVQLDTECISDAGGLLNSKSDKCTKKKVKKRGYVLKLDNSNKKYVLYKPNECTDCEYTPRFTFQGSYKDQVFFTSCSHGDYGSGAHAVDDSCKFATINLTTGKITTIDEIKKERARFTSPGGEYGKLSFQERTSYDNIIKTDNNGKVLKGDALEKFYSGIVIVHPQWTKEGEPLYRLVTEDYFAGDRWTSEWTREEGTIAATTTVDWMPPNLAEGFFALPKPMSEFCGDAVFCGISGK